MIKKSMVLLLLFVILMISYQSSAFLGIRRLGPFGIGAAVGAPETLTLTGKLYVNRYYAFDAMLNLGAFGGKVYAHSDFLFPWERLFRAMDQQFDGYYGVGGTWNYDADADDDDDLYSVGIRLPFGITTLYRSIDVEAFAEAALAVDVMPSTNTVFQVYIGARYYF